MPKPAAVPCVLMRGGTSRAVFLRAEDLPPDGPERDRIILDVFGSPDPRQIDGLGGADPLTSKLAIIGRDAPEDCHVSYTFGQVEIDRASIDYESLCGNITSAVGHYAVVEGLCPVREPVTRVRIFNTNLRCVLTVDVPVSGGRVLDEGDFVVPGVPGSGARIRVDLANTAGARLGAVLPTGSPTDTLACSGIGEVVVTLMDVGNPHVFVRSVDFGLTGTETAASLAADHEIMRALETVRAVAAVRLGLVDRPEQARANTPAIPILGVVGPPQDYVAEGVGRPVPANDLDLAARLLFMQRPHKAYAGTSTVCTGVAARLPGTVVAEVARPLAADPTTPIEVRIGHPAGVIVTETAIDMMGTVPRVLRATVDRTARRILDGTVYLKAERLEAV